MQTAIAKVFTSGNSQAIRLPKEFRLDASEVYIHKSGDSLILTPRMPTWDGFVEGLSGFSPDFSATGGGVDMSTVGQKERASQNRVVKLFSKTLKHAYLGNWEERPHNSHIEQAYLRAYLARQGASPSLIDRALLSNRARSRPPAGVDCERRIVMRAMAPIVKMWQECSSSLRRGTILKPSLLKRQPFIRIAR